MFINFFVTSPEDTLALNEKLIFSSDFGDGVTAEILFEGVGFMPSADNTPYVEARLRKDGEIVETLPHDNKVWGDYNFTFGDEKYTLSFQPFDEGKKKALLDRAKRIAVARGEDDFYYEASTYPENTTRLRRSLL